MLRRILFLVLFASALHAPLRAQVVGGTISGTVSDPTGALIPNAQVIVHNEDTGTQRTLTTNNSGAYSAPSIPVGTYKVTVTAPGFAAFHRDNVTSPSANPSCCPSR